MFKSIRSSRFMILFLLAICTPPVFAQTPAADLRLPAVFTDHMVLQREAPIAVWGWAAPGGTVAVALNDQHATTTVGTDGTWRLELPSMTAGGPYTLSVEGAERIALTDVWLGDVWVASGQSNMEWPLQTTNNAEAEIEAAFYPNIRLFQIANAVAYTPQQDLDAWGWVPVTPETVPTFSAIAYFFGRHLHDALNVPIGLINTTWGGTPAEAWTSASALNAAMPDFSESIAAMAGGDASPLSFEEQRNAWLQAIKDNDRGYEGADPVWAAPTFDDAAWPTMDAPQLWEGAGLPAYDGVVWLRKDFDLPDGWQGQDLTLNLAMIDDVDSTWVNGVLVGHTSTYNAHRAYPLPADLLKATDNVIAVRVLDTGGGGGIWGEPENLNLANGDDHHSLAGTWRYQASLAPDVDLPTPPQNLQNQPTTLFNAMVAPLIPYGIRGAIWYQGESNAGRAYQYRTLFPTMIQDWRTRWGLGDFPFLFVQLANFMTPQQNPVEPETWPELREAQSMTLTLPNTAQAVILDLGEADDIHPRNKQDVGKRLALAALNLSYGEDLVHAGPTYRSMTREGNTIRLHFDHVGSGLVARGGTLKGFAIAGADKRFVWADAEIDGETIVVSSPEVAAPVAVRYAWANNPIISLYNREGLPASSFRTDDWPGVTQPRQ